MTDAEENQSDASHEDHYDWWEHEGTSSTHHVVHGTRDAIAALRLLHSEWKDRGRWIEIVKSAIQPLRPGDPVELWGADLADPYVVVRQIEAIRTLALTALGTAECRERGIFQEDAEDIADAERTRKLWESRTESDGSDKGFVIVDPGLPCHTETLPAREEK